MKARAKKAPPINIHSEKYIRILQMLETQLKRNRKGNTLFYHSPSRLSSMTLPCGYVSCHLPVLHTSCKGDRSGRLQEIPQLIIVNEILLQSTSRRFLRELDEAPGGNNLHYILQCLRVPASVTRV